MDDATNVLLDFMVYSGVTAAKETKDGTITLKGKEAFIELTENPDTLFKLVDTDKYFSIE